jgi:hypothetical protein
MTSWSRMMGLITTLMETRIARVATTRIMMNIQQEDPVLAPRLESVPTTLRSLGWHMGEATSQRYHKNIMYDSSPHLSRFPSNLVLF